MSPQSVYDPEQHARLLTDYCLAVQPGERVLVQTTTLALPLVEALHRTLTTGRGTFWSRSRQRYWVKGETSGHTQRVLEVRLDCDGDTLLVSVDQTGPACHTGARTCFDADVLLADAPSRGAGSGVPAEGQ